MKQLQNRIPKLYCCRTPAFISCVITDSISNMFAEPRLETLLQFALFIALNLTLDISLLHLLLIYFGDKKKAFEIENNRQREEQNLLYSSIVHDIRRL